MTSEAENLPTPSVLVLGPIAVVEDDRPIALRGQQARVLSLLAAHYPDPVSTEGLIDELWPDGAPKSGRTGLAVVVHRLRERLARAGHSLRSEAASYVLDVGADDLDHVVFTRAVERAESAASPDQAVTELRAALDLWRGGAFQPFAGSPRVRLHAAFLDGERLRAEELLAQALLDAGQNEAAAGLASRLAEAEPYRENRWELLMLALYRSGRQGESLRAAQRAKTVLAEDLGLSPGARLLQLESDIATQQPELNSPPAASDIAPTPVVVDVAPRPRPRTDGHFIGRVDEEEQLARLLGTSRLVTLVGPGGVGKTRLVAQYAAGEAIAEVHWLDLIEVRADGLMSALAHVLGVRADGEDHRLIVEALRARPTLLVVDNCEHVAAAVADVIEKLLGECSDLQVIATSRASLACPSERQLLLAPLPVEEGVQLLLDRAPLVDGLQQDRARLVAIVEQLDSMPLHLELVAPTLATVPLEDVLVELSESVEFLHGRGRADPRHQSLTSAIDWSLELLSETDQQLFDSAGLMAGVFTAAELALVSEQPLAEVRSGVARLASQSLVHPVTSGHGRGFRQLNTVRTHARDRLRARGQLDAGARRHAQVCRQLVASFDDALAAADEAGAVAELQRWSDQLTSAFRWSLANGEAATCVGFVLTMWEYSFLRQDFLRYDWPETLIAHLDDAGQPVPAELLGAGALAAWARDRFAVSENLAARAEAAAAVDGLAPPIQAMKARLNVAVHDGRNDDAGALLGELIRQSREVADDRHHADNLVVLAMALAQFGAIDQAAQSARDAVELANRTENPTAIAWAKIATGIVDSAIDPTAASRSFTAAQALALSVKNVWVEGMALSGLVTSLRRSGRLESARQVLVEVISLWSRTRATSQLHRACVEAVLVLAALGDDERAARVLARVDLEVGTHPLMLADDRATLDQVAAELRRLDVAVDLVASAALGAAVLAELTEPSR